MRPHQPALPAYSEPLRVADPSRESESRIRVANPSRESESHDGPSLLRTPAALTTAVTLGQPPPPHRQSPSESLRTRSRWPLRVSRRCRRPRWPQVSLSLPSSTRHTPHPAGRMGHLVTREVGRGGGPAGPASTSMRAWKRHEPAATAAGRMPTIKNFTARIARLGKRRGSERARRRRAGRCSPARARRCQPPLTSVAQAEKQRRGGARRDTS